MDQQKDDTVRPDGRQDKKRKEEGRGTRIEEGNASRAKKAKTAFLAICPAGGPRTTHETQRKAETKGKKTKKQK